MVENLVQMPSHSFIRLRDFLCQVWRALRGYAWPSVDAAERVVSTQAVVDHLGFNDVGARGTRDRSALTRRL